MTAKKAPRKKPAEKKDRPLSLDIPFDEAMERFIGTDPKEINMDDDTPTGGEIELPKASHQGQMTVGDLNLDCYVLEDGRRVFHKRGMARALGLKSEGGNAFMRSMTRKGIGSELGDTLIERIANPVNFKPLTQDLAHGYEADVLVDVCKAIIKAKEAGKLSKTQENLAVQARILLNAFAKVGVTALIDEATGFQQVRDPKALRILVQQYIEAEKQEWMKQFPDSYYDELNRIYGSKRLTQTSAGTVIQNRPQHFAMFTRNYVYQPLENGAVLEELDRINPKIDKRGTRKARFHQHLTHGYGIEKLKRQVQEVQTLMAVSDTINQFKKLFQKRFPQKGDQLDLLND
ncbi:P63C domain-containing protein [Allosphingosinicella vermicomposti]|uniref:P63C domain-containing protein n=1 Tax=Allosphingosinicella vermicomposti TaxID=614671 RepID=UPI000D107B2C|nr:P63C domain-containing protein [Allosphingosinicella vermicomposti]